MAKFGPSCGERGDLAVWRAASQMPSMAAYGPRSGTFGQCTSADVLLMKSDVLPPPPRPPRLAALMASNAAAKTESLGMISSSGDAELRRSCWRLRWCAFCLLVATAMQASTVGSSLHLLYSLDEGDDGRLTLQLLSASIVLLLLLIAFWSLLSQLLLWSDVRVRDGRKGDLV